MRDYVVHTFHRDVRRRELAAVVVRVLRLALLLLALLHVLSFLHHATAPLGLLELLLVLLLGGQLLQAVHCLLGVELLMLGEAVHRRH